MSTSDELKKWDKLTISNDFIFCKVMSDKEICKEVLEVLLERKVGDILYIDEQKTIDLELDSKSVRLDIFVKDDERIYNIEMQVVNNRNLPRRMRYYQDVIDLEFLRKSDDYNLLKDTIILFICKFDPFNFKVSRYGFENKCTTFGLFGMNEDLCLGDGTYKTFLNSKDYYIDPNPKIREFLQYVQSNVVTDDELIKKLDARVKKIKQNRKWRNEYMTLRMREKEIAVDNFEKGLSKGRKEGRQKGIKEGLTQGRKEGRQKGIEEGLTKGRKQGKQEGIVEIAKNMFKQNLSVEMISSITGLSIEEINNLK